MRVACILFLEIMFRELIFEAMDDIVEGLVLAEEFLALAAALDGVPGVDEDGHLFEELVLSRWGQMYFILSLEWRCALLNSK